MVSATFQPDGRDILKAGSNQFAATEIVEKLVFQQKVSSAKRVEIVVEWDTAGKSD